MYPIRFILLIPLLIILASIVYSCNDGFEDYSSDPNHKLTFSTDTIAFDTIISTINTPFKAFKVYNRNSKNLLISSVILENGTESNFKINVDGRAGHNFSNIEIRANDSIFVFVDAKPAETGINTPKYLKEYISFFINGNHQKVLIEASSQDAFIWKGVIINKDSTLNNEKPYVIYDSLVIEKDALLTITEGTTFYMHGNSEILIKGTINAKGTLEKPIVFRGDRFDQMVNIPYDLIPGQWGGMRFFEESYNNEFEYVHIRNGIFGMDFMPSETLLSKISLKNVVMTNFKGYLINAVNCKFQAENCEFSNSLNALLNLTGGDYSFTHCTIANHYPSANESGWGNSNNETILIKNKYLIVEEEKVDSVFYPVNKANFYNCIVWGAKDKSSSKVSINQSKQSELFYLFENCLLPNGENDNPEDEQATVINCIIGKNPEFKTILYDEDGKAEFIFDFRLTEKSPARNIANRVIAEALPEDIQGINRFLDQGPDIGAYEWKEDTENTN